MKKHFDKYAKEWDKEKRRTDNALKIAKAIQKEISFSSQDKILDFGAGTGLLSWEFASQVDFILGVDTSKEMTKAFLSKDWPCNVHAVTINLCKHTPYTEFDGIVSSMTLHHVDNVDDYFSIFNKLLKKDGFIAIADLVTEDGDFHTSGNSGVYHLGFEPIEIESMLRESGFYDITHKIVNVIKKETATREIKQFPVFLVLAKKI